MLYMQLSDTISGECDRKTSKYTPLMVASIAT